MITDTYKLLFLRICFLGEATITCRIGENEQTEVLPRGSVFGAIHMFENTWHVVDHSLTAADILNVSITQGTILKILYKDFYERVLLKAIRRGNPVDVNTVDNSSSIDPASITTQEDSLPLRITSRIEEKVPPKIFKFLNESRLMPPPFEYIFHGSLGRSFNIHDTSQPMLFILVEGGIRLEIIPKRKLDIQRITHIRSGQQPTEFKV